MLDLGWSEAFFIMVLALVVVGPRDLPKVARAAGRALGQARRLYQGALNSIGTLEREVALSDDGSEEDLDALRARRLSPELLQQKQTSCSDPHAPRQVREEAATGPEGAPPAVGAEAKR